MDRKISIAILATALMVLSLWAAAVEYGSPPGSTVSTSQGNRNITDNDGVQRVRLCPREDGGCPITPAVLVVGADGLTDPAIRPAADAGVWQTDPAIRPAADAGTWQTDPAIRPAADAGAWKTAPEDGGAFHNWTQYESNATQTMQNLAPVAQDAGMETNQVCYVVTNNCALTAYVAMGTGAATLTAAAGAATDGIPIYPGVTRKICGESLPALYHRASADSGVCLSVEKLTRP